MVLVLIVVSLLAASADLLWGFRSAEPTVRPTVERVMPEVSKDASLTSEGKTVAYSIGETVTDGDLTLTMLSIHSYEQEPDANQTTLLPSKGKLTVEFQVRNEGEEALTLAPVRLMTDVEKPSLLGSRSQWVNEPVAGTALEWDSGDQLTVLPGADLSVTATVTLPLLLDLEKTLFVRFDSASAPLFQVNTAGELSRITADKVSFRVTRSISTRDGDRRLHYLVVEVTNTSDTRLLWPKIPVLTPSGVLWEGMPVALESAVARYQPKSVVPPIPASDSLSWMEQWDDNVLRKLPTLLEPGESERREFGFTLPGEDTSDKVLLIGDQRFPVK